MGGWNSHKAPSVAAVRLTLNSSHISQTQNSGPVVGAELTYPVPVSKEASSTRRDTEVEAISSGAWQPTYWGGSG